MQVVSSQGRVLEELAAGAQFAAGKGISRSAQGPLWFNGLLSSGASWRSSLFTALQGEMPTLQVHSLSTNGFQRGELQQQILV